MGNITRIEDEALQTVFYANQRVEPAAEYTYDPLYRLLAATGREHSTQSAFSFAPANGDYRDFPFVGAAQLHDPQALRNYAERYEYDSVGNCICLRHEALGGNFDRTYAFDSPSLLEPWLKNNRLSHTTVRNGSVTLIERYRHDANGNMTQMPHLPRMAWDFQDRLRSTSRQVVNLGKPEQTHYVYDAAGQRARKITLRPDGNRKSERYYLGGFEIYRAYDGDGVELQRDTLHVMDDNRRIALVETLTIENGKPSAFNDSVKHYQLANHLGSASLELDGHCALLTYEEFTPYGNSTFQAGSSAEVSLKRYRYTGKERDEESGFTYHGARYCAPWLGRWTACDSIGIGDGPNLYLFVKGNPIRLVDPNGRDARKPGEISPELKAAWDAADRANFDDASVNALVEAQDRDFNERGVSLFTKEGILARATIRAAAAGRQWTVKNYGTSVFQGAIAVDESLGYGMGMFGDTVKGTAVRMVAFAVAPTVLKKTLGRLRSFVGSLGRSATPPVPLTPPVVPDVPPVTPDPPAITPDPPPASPPPSPEVPQGGTPAETPQGSPGAVGAEPAPAKVTYDPQLERYEATYGADEKAYAMFKAKGSGVEVTDLFRGNQPTGSAGKMLADALGKAGKGTPGAIRFSGIINERTLAELGQRLAPGETLLGKTLSNTVKELGGKITGWSSGVYRGKPWIEATISY
jgi:RHS repeat-associated protein